MGQHHFPDFGVGDDLGHRKAVQDGGVAAGMILLGVQADQVVDLADAGFFAGF